jgi:CheY-like chemotaxis protein
MVNCQQEPGGASIKKRIVWAMPRNVENRPARILVVDDHPLMAKVVSSTLSEEGYRTDIAMNGEEALSMIARNTRCYDLVVTDQRMPRLSGMDLIRRLQKTQFAGKVVLMSADSTLTERRPIGGADAFLSKPFTPEHLSRTVSALIGRP